MKIVRKAQANESEKNSATLKVVPIKDASKARYLSVVRAQVDYSQFADIDLIIACQQGSEGAFGVLFNRYKRLISNMFHKLAPDWNDTSDLEQEAVIRVWRSIKQLRNPQAFKPWLSHIVSNLFYDELRKRPRDCYFVSIDEPLRNDNGTERGTREIVDTAQQPDAKLLTSELSQVLADALSTIPEQFRTAAILRDVEGLGYEEIAQITETELGTVKSRISRARAKIQKRLSPYLRDAA
jgi:RNA polymerase sigma-70 factor (ECF subfamily)